MRSRLGMIMLLALTTAQWSSDIDYVRTELPKRHPNAFFHASRASFESMLEAIKPDLPTLSNSAVAIRIQQAVALLGDGHTEVDTRIDPWTYFPVRIDWFDDGAFVTRTTDESRRACGARLVAIDGVPAEEVLARVATVVSHENEPTVLARFPATAARAEVLATLGIAASTETARFTFESTAGTRFDLDLHAITRADAAATILATTSSPNAPLYRRDAALPYWFVWLPESRLVYVKYNSCRDDPSRPFASFATSVLSTIDANTIDAVVIDVRNNPGGASIVAKPLIDGLAARTQLRGRVFVIVGRETFSSAVINAIDLRNIGAMLVGEPTGGKPNSYGEVKTFNLPASGITVFHSSRFFQLQPEDTDSLMPSRTATFTSDDYFAGRDPVLASIVPEVRATAVESVGARRRVASAGRHCGN